MSMKRYYSTSLAWFRQTVPFWPSRRLSSLMVVGNLSWRDFKAACWATNNWSGYCTTACHCWILRLWRLLHALDKASNTLDKTYSVKKELTKLSLLSVFLKLKWTLDKNSIGKVVFIKCFFKLERKNSKKYEKRFLIRGGGPPGSARLSPSQSWHFSRPLSLVHVPPLTTALHIHMCLSYFGSPHIILNRV